jgi:protein involved in polysaccharide export with SLBB domain
MAARMKFRFAKSIVCSFILAVALQVSGCSSNVTAVTEAEQQALSAAAEAAPRLQAGEKIRVNVFGEESLSGSYDIDPSGYVSLPLAGTVKAAGLTQTELEKVLSQKFRTEYLRNPKVTVTISSFRPFYILGEVEKPGEYPYKSGLNVLSALALAGGPTYRASRSTILIQNPGEAKMREYPMSSSVPILPGALIRVPERYF